MPDARYFLPDHPDLPGDYSREDLRLLLQTGKLSRSDMVMDDQTGLAHLVGALLASPYHLSPVRRKPQSLDDEDDPPAGPPRTLQDTRDIHDSITQTPKPVEEVADISDDLEQADPADLPEEAEHVEFRAATPLRQREHDPLEIDHYGLEDDGEDEYYDDGEGGEEDEDEEDLMQPNHPRAESPHAIVRDPPQEEELILHGHPSWLSYRKSLLGFLALAAVSILAQRFHLGLAWCVTAAALALLCLAFVALDRMTTEYFLTSRRVEVVSGLIGRNSKEIRIADIRAIDVTQTGLNALFAVGTLEFFSSAGDEADVCFENVNRPHRLKQIVRDLQG